MINVITVSQQFGSSGSKTAAKLACKLGWRLTDHEIVAQVASRLGITEEEAALYNEHAYSFVDRILLYMQFSTSEAVEAWASQFIMPLSPQYQEHLYQEALRQVIETNARRGNIVIVGHGAQALLANQPNVLHVWIAAPLAERVSAVVQRERLDEADAFALIQQKDRYLARYLQSQYHRDLNDPLLYDLVVNSSYLDLESQVDLICLALERKAHWLALASPKTPEQQYTLMSK